MAQARIRIDLVDGQWKADIPPDYASLTFEIIGTVLRDETAAETVLLSGCETSECLPELESHPDVAGLDVVDSGMQSATVRLETAEPTVLAAISQAGTPLVYPAQLGAGTLRATVVGTHGDISTLGDHLEVNGLGVEVEAIRGDHDIDRVLTDRQEEVFFTAVQHGYYGNPRQCTLTDVADALDIAKSTCSGTLQRSEAAVVDYFCLHQHRRGGATVAERFPAGEQYRS